MNSVPIQPEPTSSISRHRPVLPVLNLLVAGAAVTVAAVAIATGDASSLAPQPARVVPAAVEAPALWWAEPAQHPANQDPRPSAHQTSAAPALWWADPAQHPANQDPRPSAHRTGTAPSLWWAERR